MTETTKPVVGTVGWFDLTVAEGDRLRDFYAAVTGWKPEPQSMGDYSDYTMLAADGTPVGGVCHARGANAELPPQWLIYVSVADLDRSLTECRERGGAVVSGPRDMGPYGRLAVIRDPAGAVMAIIQPPA